MREKNLEIQRNKLSFEVEKKTRDLIKSEKMASVGQLSSRLVHDLRNPLTVVKSTVELLKLGNKEMDKKTAEKFERIQRAMKKNFVSNRGCFRFCKTIRITFETTINFRNFRINTFNNGYSTFCKN